MTGYSHDPRGSFRKFKCCSRLVQREGTSSYVFFPFKNQFLYFAYVFSFLTENINHFKFLNIYFSYPVSHSDMPLRDWTNSVLIKSFLIQKNLDYIEFLENNGFSGLLHIFIFLLAKRSGPRVLFQNLLKQSVVVIAFFLSFIVIFRLKIFLIVI